MLVFYSGTYSIGRRTSYG